MPEGGAHMLSGPAVAVVALPGGTATGSCRSGGELTILVSGVAPRWAVLDQAVHVGFQVTDAEPRETLDLDLTLSSGPTRPVSRRFSRRSRSASRAGSTGAGASEALNPFWFHRPSALAYFAQLGAPQAALPEISIELYLSPHVDVLQQLRGVYNSQKLDAPGVALRVAPSPGLPPRACRLSRRWSPRPGAGRVLRPPSGAISPISRSCDGPRSWPPR